MSHSKLALFTTAALLTCAADAQSTPSGFVVDQLWSSMPPLATDLGFLPDGRALIASSIGDITLYANGNSATLGNIPNVQFGGEAGLLSVTSDPQFAQNGYIYVYYNSTTGSTLHVDRFTCVGDRSNPNSLSLTLDLASRHPVLDTLTDNWPEHNGGSLRFGPDGMLYATTGDDLDPCATQDPNSTLGCVVRMDVSGLPAGGSTNAPSYAALDPGDNPMSANSGFTQLVIAHGLRNPFRMEIDPVTGSLYIGDVGSDTRDEISEYVISSSAMTLVNFGWPWREGDVAGNGCVGSQPTGLAGPIAVLPVSPTGSSIIAGPVYRNLGGVHDYGAAYEGNAFYTDLFTGDIFRLTYANGWNVAAPVAGQPSPGVWADGFGRAVALRQGPDGALWGLLRRPWGVTELLRIRRNVSATTATYGVGCGTPPMAFQPTAAPLVTGSLSGTVTNTPTPLCVIAVGLSKTSIPGIGALPFDLGLIGMPGCTLYQSAEVFGLSTQPSTTPFVSDWSIPVPGGSIALGLHIYAQAFTVAPGANSLQLIASNGVGYRVGNQ